jgi:hypothetical protein
MGASGRRVVSPGALVALRLTPYAVCLIHMPYALCRPLWSSRGVPTPGALVALRLMPYALFICLMSASVLVAWCPQELLLPYALFIRLMPYALFICRMPYVGASGRRVVSRGALVVFLFLLATQARELPVGRSLRFSLGGF